MSVVNDIFNRVIFDGDDRQYLYNLHTKMKAFAEEIHQNVPDCADKTLAFRALHLAFMHVECAIGQKIKYK